LGLSGTGEGGGGHGEGIGLGSVGTLGGDPASSAISVGNLAALSQAESVESGALFRYSLKAPVDLSAHASSLVPFVDNQVDVSRIATFSRPGADARSGVFLVHQGNQTLPQGPIAIFADGGFAGEASLWRMKPKQSTVVEFGMDLDVELREIEVRENEETRLLEFVGGALREHYVEHKFMKLEIENRSASGREVFLKLNVANNARVTGADKLAYDSIAKRALAVFRIARREKKVRLLRTDEGLMRWQLFKGLTSHALARFGASRSLPQTQKAIVAEARSRLFEAEVGWGSVKLSAAELRETQKEIVRLREHVRALHGRDSEGAEAIVERLLAAENRAKKLGARVALLKTAARAKTLAAERALKRLGARR
jgi:hypothetical protein